MMKKLRIFAFVASMAATALALAGMPVDAQWQTPDHSVPIGNGAGIVGFSNAAPGTAGQPLVSNGPSADPSFQLLLDIIPIGAVLDYTGTTAPNAHFQLAFGQAISRAAFPAYFALVGTTYGAGDGSTTFNVPDLRGRAVAGVDNMGGSTAGRITVAGGNFNGTVLGGVGGLENHALTGPEGPVHSHTATDSGHTHNVTADDNTNVIGGVNGGNAGTFALFNTTTPAHTITSTVGTANITVSNAGSGAPHTILSPTIVLNKIVRVQFWDEYFASRMLGVANDNDEIWYKAAVGE